MSELYALVTTSQGYKIVKWDEWAERLTIYNLTQRRGWMQCECFAANKETCRHREMVALFTKLDRVDKGWVYDYTADQWVKPTDPTRRRKC